MVCRLSFLFFKNCKLYLSITTNYFPATSELNELPISTVTTSDVEKYSKIYGHTLYFIIFIEKLKSLLTQLFPID